MENTNLPFDFNEFSALDIKAILIKILSYWKWFLLSLVLAFFIVKYVNAYQQRIYSLNSLITVKDEQNPIFTSSTNIAFNWGGPSDKVETIKTILKSRTHNEKVVQETQYYVDYLVEGKYRMEDVYGKVPFKLAVDTTTYQLLNTLIELKFLSEEKVQIRVDFNESEAKTLERYSDAHKKHYEVIQNIYEQVFPIGKINTDFLGIDLSLTGNPNLDKTYFIKFNDFNATVSKYRGIDVSTAKKGTSLISLALNGPNKKRLVDYLNSTVKVLEKDQIAAKIKYAVKTKNYIDTLFNDMALNLSTIEKDLGNYKEKQNIYNLSAEGSTIFKDVIELDNQQQHLQDRLDYFNSLESYLKNRETYDSGSIPVPAVIEVEDSKIASSIGALISKTKAKENLLQNVTEDFPGVKQLSAEIELERNALYENINMLRLEIQNNLNRVNKRLSENQFKLKKLPVKEQQLLSFERKYVITENNYNYLKQKSYEAGTAIASNVSDIKVIDNAKDIGQGFIKPNIKFNRLIGLALALALPLIIILLLEFFNNKIHTIEEVEKNYKIPILGVIGTNTEESNLVIFNQPKSPMAESYRALHSNVRFLLKRGAKSNVLLVTSSISGEGKTLTAMNLAGVFSISNKKTVLVGVDLRKPKLAEDFNLNKNIGLVHYLIGNKKPEEIIQQTTYDNLDVILSGPVPPNPFELLLSEETGKLIEYLKEHYEYIILDAPPIGAVADAQELFQYADTVLYVVRQDYTEKGQLKMIENKYKRKEIENISYVLSDFTFSKRHGYGYGYGSYAYGGYGYGYYESEKKPFWKRWFSRKS